MRAVIQTPAEEMYAKEVYRRKLVDTLAAVVLLAVASPVIGGLAGLGVRTFRWVAGW